MTIFAEVTEKSALTRGTPSQRR